MNRKFLALVSFLTLVPFVAIGGVKVTSVDLKTSGQKGQINIRVDGRSSELPDLKVNGQTIEVTLHKANKFQAIERNIQGAQISANVLNGKAVVKAVLPYNVPADKVSLALKGNNVSVNFPRGKIIETPKPAAATAKVEEKKEAKKNVSKTSKDSLNEEYLNKLMRESKGEKKVAAAKDAVSVKQAAPDTVEEAPVSSDGFSFAGYAAKFTIFLAMVLGLFYSIVQLLKKGVFNRGKLGFLNNNGQLIEVLSTTYIGPKRTLMVVRAHKQIFLVGSSETGLTFLSEMKDTSGLIKEGERHITGTNFDLNLNDAEGKDSEGISLKENIMESSPLPEDKGIAALSAKDIVKFSEELKKKAKKLRPIEFNN